MNPLSLKVLLIITLVFPKFHMTEYIPFRSYEECQAVASQHDHPTYGPFRITLSLRHNDGSPNGQDKDLIPKVRTECKSYSKW